MNNEIPRNQHVRLPTLLALLLIASCSKPAPPPGPGFQLPAPGATSEAPKMKDWDTAAAITSVQNDHGAKSGYNCFIYSESTYNQRNVARDLPELGVRKLSDNEVLVQASSEPIAREILTKAWIGPVWGGGLQHPEPEQLRIKGCRPQSLASTASAADKAFSDYRTLDDARDAAFLYFALRGGHVPYEAIAAQFWPEYASETDAFRKKDLLTKLSTDIDRGIAAAAANPYVRLDVSGRIGNFDFSGNRYPLDDALGRDIYIAMSGSPMNYVVRFNAAEDFLSYRPANEAAARAIEAALSADGRSVAMEIYGKVERADEMNGRPYVLLTPTRLLVRPARAGSGSASLFEITLPR